MTSNPLTPIKTHHNRKLFRSEPPSGRDIIELFHGRESELTASLGMLRYNLDAREKVSDPDDFFGEDETKAPWIVHGPTRSGKSHLGRRIMADFTEDKRHRQIFLPCRERLDPAMILQQIFEKICGIFFELITLEEKAPGFQDNRPRQLLVAETKDLIQSIAPFCDPHPPRETNVKTSTSMLDVIRAEFQAKIPAVFQFWLQTSRQIGTDNSYNAIFSSPSAEHYSTFCGIIVDTLTRLNLLDHLLILVDDADLLENEYKTSSDAKIKTVHLSDALVNLHRWRGVDILVTARSHYAISKKEFHELIDLNGYPMQVPDLIQIYRAHVNKFGWEGHKNGFLTDEALEKASQWAGLLPGVFLEHLTIALAAFNKESSWDARDTDWYRLTFKNFYASYRADYGDADRLLEKAAQENRLEIAFQRGDPNPFYGIKFDNIFVIQSYYSDTTCKVLPIVREILGN